MKTPLRLLALGALSTLPLFAQTPPETRSASPAVLASQPASSAAIAAVRTADDRRLAATTAADRTALDKILSDDLHYGHSNGRIDTKATLIAALTRGHTAYEKFNYKERSFRPVGSDAMLMTGRVLIDVRSNDQKRQIDLAYLAVWRNENGTWRFLAWQSCQVPPAQ